MAERVHRKPKKGKVPDENSIHSVWTDNKLVALRADIFLPVLYLAYVATTLPLYSHMFAICHRGVTQAWTAERYMACRQEDMPLSPMGRMRI